MLFYYLFHKPETEQQRIIRYADIMVLNSDYTGELDKSCLDLFKEIWELDKPKKFSPPLQSIWEEVIRLQPKSSDGITINVDILKEYIQKNFDDVRTHLLTYDYIDKPDYTQKWFLNDVGKSMKTHKGHLKYQKFKENELLALKRDHKSKLLPAWLKIVLKAVATVGATYGLKLLYELIKARYQTP